MNITNNNPNNYNKPGLNVNQNQHNQNYQHQAYAQQNNSFNSTSITPNKMKNFNPNILKDENNNGNSNNFHNNSSENILNQNFDNKNLQELKLSHEEITHRVKNGESKILLGNIAKKMMEDIRFEIVENMNEKFGDNTHMVLKNASDHKKKIDSLVTDGKERNNNIEILKYLRDKLSNHQK